MKLCQKYLVLCFALFIGLNANAQKINISNSVKLNNKNNKFKILGKTGNKFLVERYGSSDHILDIYNSNLKLTSSKQINLEKNEFLKKIWVQPNQSWLIKLQHNKNNTAIQALRFDKNLTTTSKVQTLDSIVERKDLLESNLRTKLSLNETKILLYAPIFNQNRIEYFYSKVYDQNLKLINQKKITDVNLINQNFIKSFLFNSGAYVFITTNNTEDQFYFTFINSNGEITSHRYTPIKDIFKKLAFNVDEKNEAIIISGFFSKEKENRKDKTGAQEFFISKFDLNTFTNIYTEIVPFTNELYRNLTGKDSKINPPQLYTFYINSIIPKNDGGALVFAESYFKNEEEYINNSYFSVSGLTNYTSTTVYNYNDIIIYDVDSNGVFVDYQIIRKKQVSQDDNGSYSSFYVANLQDQLKIIFLDEIDIESHLSQATINTSKNTKSYNIMNIGSQNVLPVVGMSKQTSPNEVVIPSFLRNKMQLIKLTY